VASLTYVDPVSPYGFGGVHRDGTLCYPDAAGSGGGLVNKEFIARLRAGDQGADSPFSPRNVMNHSYWALSHREPPAREDLLVDEMLRTLVGDGYPGDTTPSNNWPGAAPGTRGVLNALSPKYCDWSGIVDLDRKPRILWTAHGCTPPHCRLRQSEVGGQQQCCLGPLDTGRPLPMSPDPLRRSRRARRRATAAVRAPTVPSQVRDIPTPCVRLARATRFCTPGLWPTSSAVSAEAGSSRTTVSSAAGGAP
jgi:hypothetical protein